MELPIQAACWYLLELWNWYYGVFLDFCGFLAMNDDRPSFVQEYKGLFMVAYQLWWNYGKFSDRWYWWCMKFIRRVYLWNSGGKWTVFESEKSQSFVRSPNISQKWTVLKVYLKVHRSRQWKLFSNVNSPRKWKLFSKKYNSQCKNILL